MVAWGCVPVGVLFHLHLHLRLHLCPSTSRPSGATVALLQLLCDILPGDLAGVYLPPLGLRYGLFRGSAIGSLGLPSTASQGFLQWRHLHRGVGLGASTSSRAPSDLLPSSSGFLHLPVQRSPCRPRSSPLPQQGALSAAPGLHWHPIRGFQRGTTSSSADGQRLPVWCTVFASCPSGALHVAPGPSELPIQGSQ